MSFTNIVRSHNARTAHQAPSIYLISATEQGKPAWFVLQLHPHKTASFSRMSLLRKGNIADYGQILESGWGTLENELRATLIKRYDL